ncbi:MAG TPA: endonuclease [Candidatus Pacebacteria bacterium]|uniref:GIY-YIG domain-containing protein n=1 Tax=Candidatus Gottesmanbacteria bacterium RIFCSPLOWO2_01_FULL_46_21 TaxID=1798393 RepID=A0A1F6B0W5_9BACT|nr:MAG: hypothetical protein A2971_04115 [Candidatus Gottesmanbacteria bacterium RIFCSPLOWO2_01_FULL_46_21]HCR81421.1 endonuclease [Candidatus Paceibacterota bacterium]
MYFVYILKSTRKQTYYKGLTNNLSKRLKQHFSGQVVSTKSLLPLDLIHVELCSDRALARKTEKFFKSGFGREIIKELDLQKI